MCLRPRFIYVFRDKTKLHKQLAYKQVVDKFAYPGLRERVEPRFVQRVQVPCGHCVECLRARQSDLAARVAIAAKDAHSLHHLTLTYSEDTVPLCARKAFVSIETGEVVLDNVPVQLCRLSRNVKPLFNEYYIADFRKKIHKMRRSPQARVLTVDSHYITASLDDPCSLQDDRFLGWDTYYFVSPSLQRRDVRLWLKRSRVRYEREFGVKMSDFKYVCAGEFGPRTCRPHYHILFIGAKDKEVKFLQSQWQFGFSKYKKIPEINKDGSSGFVLAAKYVSKYIVKGDFEADSVKNGYVERPRLCLSRFIGTTLPDDLVDYYRCYDVFGRYNLDSLIVENGSRFDKQLSLEDLARLYTEFRKRAVFRFGLNSWVPLPRCIIKQLFSVHDSYYSIEKFKNVDYVRQSLVQMAFNSFVEGDFLDDFIRELRSNDSLSESEILDKVVEYLSSEEISIQKKEEVGRQNLREFYANSIY